MKRLLPDRPWLRLAAAPALVAALPGCGFHLQNTGSTLPPELAQTFIASDDKRSEFVDSLRDVLRLHGVELVPESEATAVLEIVQDETSQSVLSVSARNSPREYEIYYVVAFTLRIDGEERLKPPPIVLTRAYTYDETKVLAKSREEQVLRRALAEDLARQVVRRIEALQVAPAAVDPSA
jgi:LPS-assembly lipoprotein